MFNIMFTLAGHMRFLYTAYCIWCSTLCLTVYHSAAQIYLFSITEAYKTSIYDSIIKTDIDIAMPCEQRTLFWCLFVEVNIILGSLCCWYFAVNIVLKNLLMIRYSTLYLYLYWYSSTIRVQILITCIYIYLPFCTRTWTQWVQVGVQDGKESQWSMHYHQCCHWRIRPTWKTLSLDWGSSV